MANEKPMPPTDVELCPVVVGQQKGIGPGLFINCGKPLPCPDHPTYRGSQGDHETSNEGWA